MVSAKMWKVRYSSNNSGGVWWLTDEHWRALEAAGWVVEWFATWGVHSGRKQTRWLGALAGEAHKLVPAGSSLQDAIDDWRRVTGKDPDGLGCKCCGQPHRFELLDENGMYVNV